MYDINDNLELDEISDDVNVGVCVDIIHDLVMIVMIVLVLVDVLYLSRTTSLKHEMLDDFSDANRCDKSDFSEEKFKNVSMRDLEDKIPNDKIIIMKTTGRI